MTSMRSARLDPVSLRSPVQSYWNAWRKRSLALVLVALAYSQTPNADDLAWQQSANQHAATRKVRLEQVRQHSVRDRFQPTWKSLEQYRTPNWYRDAKFGIFV